MIDFFTKIYPNSVSKKLPVLERLHYYSFVRFIVRNTANFIIPIYFKFSNIFRIYQLLKGTRYNESTEELIVSLTSFPLRIHKLHLVIESILRQSHLPDRIILWLSKEQFPDKNMLPKKLLELQKRGLEIEFCDGDLRSHKKYYYAVIKYSSACVLTLDDDILYSSDLIKKLWNAHIDYPQAVICVRAYENIIVNNQVLSYSKWELVANETTLRNDIFPTSGAGTLYPPCVFYKDILREDLFMKYCRYADDIWLFCMVTLNDRKFVKVDYQYLFLPIMYNKNQKLASRNVGEGGNDRQLLAVRHYYLRERGIDIFKKMALNLRDH